MEIPAPTVRLQMDCLEGAWESLEGNRRCQFRGTVHFVMTSLAYPEIPARVIEACIEWEQPTPAQYERVAPAPRLLSSHRFIFLIEEVYTHSRDLMVSTQTKEVN